MTAPTTVEEFFALPVWSPDDGKKAYFVGEDAITAAVSQDDTSWSSWSLMCASDGRFMRRRDA